MAPSPHQYQLMKLIQHHLSQRELAEAMGASLGKVNYCIEAPVDKAPVDNGLVDKGLVKLENFRRNDNKRGYAYLITLSGIEEKARLTARFLRRKQAEYDAIRHEIEELQRELAKGAEA